MSKVVINLTAGPEDEQGPTIAFLVASAAQFALTTRHSRARPSAGPA
jgi:hypothetical protein